MPPPSTQRLALFIHRWTPDPLVFALGLTLGAFAGAAAWSGQGVRELAAVWGSAARGTWSLLAFSMQMCLILVLGSVVARTPPVARLLGALAAWPRTARQATALVAAVSTLGALVNWGMGLVVGALLAREVQRGMAQAGRSAHGPALAAAGYAGMAVWHGGLSGSAPLKMTQEADVQALLGPELAAQVGVLGLERTLGSPRNLLVTAAAVLVSVGLLAALTPKAPPPEPPLDAERGGEGDPVAAGPEQAPLVRWLEQGRALTLATGLLCALATAEVVRGQGLRRLDPNAINLALLAAALLLVPGPGALARATAESVRAASGIVLQFPLYAGIIGLVMHGGLVAPLATLLPADGRWLPLSTLLSAGLINLAIPSGGGQLAVQGPVVLRAAVDTGADPAVVLMALAWGDQWTNLIQPFWAVPLLGLTGRRAGELLVFTAPLGLALGGVFVLGTLL